MSIMPTSITHQLLAEKIYAVLPEKIAREIPSLPHYYLGAQGPDICFLYKPLSPGNENFGRFLHAVAPLSFFRILWQDSRKDGFVRSYAYGYLTHYAADVVFHPAVYRAMGEKEKIFLHHATEHAYDGALLEKRKGVSLFCYRLPSFGKLDVKGIYEVYARYARVNGWGELSFPSFRRALKYYAAFISFRTPFYRKKYARDAEFLFDEGVTTGVKLAGDFFSSSDGSFSPERFGKHFLTGQTAPGCDGASREKTKKRTARGSML